MPKLFATMVDEVQAELQDDGTIYLDAFVAIQLEDAIREVSDYSSYEMMETFKIESRTGTADENKANALVDDASAQFLEADVGKEIYNTTDKTWAVVTAFVDTGELTLSKDIMEDGDEPYAMFNKGCRNEFQINIGDITDHISPPKHGVARGYVEYPIGTKRNFTIEDDILTIAVDDVDSSGDSDADVEVYVWFKKTHRVSQLADLAGTVNGTVVAGATTFVIAAVGSGTEVIAENTLFTFYGSTVRGTYRIKYDLTLSSGGGTIVFWPGLESAPANGAIVAFVGSTLDTRLERLVVELTAARSLISMSAASNVLAVADLASGRALINEISKGGPGTAVSTAYVNSAAGEMRAARDYQSRGETKLGIVLNKLELLRRQVRRESKHIYQRD